MEGAGRAAEVTAGPTAVPQAWPWGRLFAGPDGPMLPSVWQKGRRCSLEAVATHGRLRLQPQQLPAHVQRLLHQAFERVYEAGSDRRAALAACIDDMLAKHDTSSITTFAAHEPQVVERPDHVKHAAPLLTCMPFMGCGRRCITTTAGGCCSAATPSLEGSRGACGAAATPFVGALSPSWNLCGNSL